MFFYASKHSYKRCITFVAPVEIYLVSLEILAPRAWRYATRVAIYGLRVNSDYIITEYGNVLYDIGLAGVYGKGGGAGKNIGFLPEG